MEHNQPVRGLHNELSIKYILLMTIWWLANPEPYREVGNTFGTTRGFFKNYIFKEFHRVPLIYFFLRLM